MRDPKAIETLREAQRTDETIENSASRMWPYVNLAGPQLKPWHTVLNENISAAILQRTWRDATSFPTSFRGSQRDERLPLTCGRQMQSPVALLRPQRVYLEKVWNLARILSPSEKQRLCGDAIDGQNLMRNRSWKRMSGIFWGAEETKVCTWASLCHRAPQGKTLLCRARCQVSGSRVWKRERDRQRCSAPSRLWPWEMPLLLSASDASSENRNKQRTSPHGEDCGLKRMRPCKALSESLAKKAVESW